MVCCCHLVSWRTMILLSFVFPSLLFLLILVVIDFASVFALYHQEFLHSRLVLSSLPCLFIRSSFSCKSFRLFSADSITCGFFPYDAALPGPDRQLHLSSSIFSSPLSLFPTLKSAHGCSPSSFLPLLSIFLFFIHSFPSFLNLRTP